MYLKSLELHGFKSFPNKTVLTFERGATVIVGPNGSGKSNISDAMRWVLGELSSRNIRGTKMVDVIFGGTDDRRPMGFAEVSVTFDNTDKENRLDSEFDEVTVTRRYYRTGESEYLINRQPKRLRDIYELFMNTGVGREGYSIIGQGKIAEIISKKSDDRRNIFEEAAGISKYRHRKEEAERKLASTKDNLDRVKDILTELENQVVPLEKDAEKARRGLAIYEEKKRADVSLWLYDTKIIRTQVEEAERAFKLSERELEIAEQFISDLESQESMLFEKSQSNKLESERLMDKIRAAEGKMHALDSALAMADANFKHSAELIEQARLRISEIEGTKSNLQSTIDGYESKKQGTQKTLDAYLDERLGYLELGQKYSAEAEEVKKAVREISDELIVEENGAKDLDIRINVLKNSKLNDNNKSFDIEKEIADYEREGQALKLEAERCEESTAGFKKDIGEKDEIIKEASGKIDSLSEEKEQLSELLKSMTLEQDAKKQRADVLQRMNDHFDGYVESVKFVMKEFKAGNIKADGEVYGPLSTLISVDNAYITAIETALGMSLQHIVVENESVAKSAMRALKAANAGRATFYPVSAIRPAGETDEIRACKDIRGYVGRADTLVSTDKRYRSVVEYLLLRTVVFDTLDNASEAAKKVNYRVKIVTLDGQVINAGGSFTGGSVKKDSGILTRLNEIASLVESAKKLDSKINETRDALAEINDEIRSSQDTLKTAEEEKELLITLSRTQFAALDNANAKYEANKNIIDKLRSDYNSLKGAQSSAEEELKKLYQDFSASEERIAALKEKREKLTLDMGVLDEKSDEYAQKAAEVYIKVAETRKDIESVQMMIDSITSRINELNDERETQNARIDKLNSSREGLDGVKGENRKEHSELEKELLELNERRREVENGGDEFDRELASVRERLKVKHGEQVTLVEVKMKNENNHQRLIERQDKLGSQLWDDYEITYEEAVALQYPPVTAENRSEIADVQSSCRAKLRALGNYNPGAIEEYARVKTRYDDLNTQYTDLTSSYDELTGIISRLETEMRSSFLTAFDTINRNFGITFKELFGGGRAELQLTDPEDVLTSGIEIKAAPPGKIINSLSLLSGGEQSFVAIALLFAILKSNPTPFCILDEIEAALDEVNVYRFGEYIKNFDDNTQFILITHRRGTMEIGNRMYGVTMPQRGISQAIELNVDELEGKQKELLDGVL